MTAADCGSDPLEDLAGWLVPALFSVGLDLASCAGWLHGPDRANLAKAIEGLDEIIDRVGRATSTPDRPPSLSRVSAAGASGDSEGPSVRTLGNTLASIPRPRTPATSVATASAAAPSDAGPADRVVNWRFHSAVHAARVLNSM